MSRHTIPAIDPKHTVTVGWDNPMSTFFAHVEMDLAHAEPEDEENDDYTGNVIVVWLGGLRHEFPRVEDMIHPLAPYAVLDKLMMDILRADRAMERFRAYVGSPLFEREA